MTTTLTAPAPSQLTYETYMAEPQTEGRYDIVEGVRIVMPGASWEHQDIVANVLIRRTPKLQTRQPDVLFVSDARLARGGGIPASGPLSVAPELVVEVVSDSETERILGDKVADYTRIGVDECWVVRPQTRTVELLQPALSGARVVAVYGEAETLVSRVFPALSLPVADVFRA